MINNSGMAQQIQPKINVITIIIKLLVSAAIKPSNATKIKQIPLILRILLNNGFFCGLNIKKGVEIFHFQIKGRKIRLLKL